MKTKVFFTAIFIFLMLFVEVKAIDSYPPKSIVKKTRSTSKAALAEVTRNLEYDFSKAAIRSSYYQNLDKLAKIVVDDNYIVSLRGHADSVGKYKPNWVLSEKRAVSVKDYLVSKGVRKSHIVTTPFGSTVPIATNKTAEGRQKNRRVEIKLKELDQ
jgi:outer membrane protein OmpA-like peptidoglycan-associated protein